MVKMDSFMTCPGQTRLAPRSAAIATVVVAPLGVVFLSSSVLAVALEATATQSCVEAAPFALEAGARLLRQSVCRTIAAANHYGRLSFG